MKKDKEWVLKEIDGYLSLEGVNKARNALVFAKGVIKQLDEPEVLSQEWIDDNSVYASSDGVTEEYVHVDDLQNLLVPKQEEVDRAYKDGYEKGKQHTSYKGYLEGLADKESETNKINAQKDKEIYRDGRRLNMDKNSSTNYYSLEEYSDLMDLVEVIFTDEMLEGVYLFNWLKYRLRACKKPESSEHEDDRKAWTYYHMHVDRILRKYAESYGENYREEDYD